MTDSVVLFYLKSVRLVRFDHQIVFIFAYCDTQALIKSKRMINIYSFICNAKSLFSVDQWSIRYNFVGVLLINEQ